MYRIIDDSEVWTKWYVLQKRHFGFLYVYVDAASDKQYLINKIGKIDSIEVNKEANVYYNDNGEKVVKWNDKNIT